MVLLHAWTDGDLQWVRLIGSRGYDRATTLVTDNKGHVFVAGNIGPELLSVIWSLMALFLNMLMPIKSLMTSRLNILSAIRTLMNLLPKMLSKPMILKWRQRVVQRFMILRLDC